MSGSLKPSTCVGFSLMMSADRCTLSSHGPVSVSLSDRSIGMNCKSLAVTHREESSNHLPRPSRQSEHPSSASYTSTQSGSHKSKRHQRTPVGCMRVLGGIRQEVQFLGARSRDSLPLWPRVRISLRLLEAAHGVSWRTTLLDGVGWMLIESSARSPRTSGVEESRRQSVKDAISEPPNGRPNTSITPHIVRLTRRNVNVDQFNTCNCKRLEPASGSPVDRGM